HGAIFDDLEEDPVILRDLVPFGHCKHMTRHPILPSIRLDGSSFYAAQSGTNLPVWQDPSCDGRRGKRLRHARPDSVPDLAEHPHPVAAEDLPDDLITEAVLDETLHDMPEIALGAETFDTAGAEGGAAHDFGIVPRRHPVQLGLAIEHVGRDAD